MGDERQMALILVIEDSPTDQAVFRKWLEKAGHDVVTRDNAEDGLAFVHERMPHLILMDVVLPGMSGFQATRALARNQATKSIPVLLISTKGMETDRAWGLRQGATGYIVKPPREDEFIARINQLVS